MDRSAPVVNRAIAVVGRATHPLHDERLPRSGTCRRVRDSRVDKVLDEGDPSHASIDLSAEFGIERDGSLQQERRDRLVVEAAAAHERVIDGRQIVPVLIKSGANRVEVAQGRKEPERVRKQAFAVRRTNASGVSRSAAFGMTGTRAMSS